MKKQRSGILKLYRGLKINANEVINFQHSIGNLISTNGYLSTSSDYSVAHGFATKPIQRENIVQALFQYEVNLDTIQSIVLADIAQYSAFPEEAEVLVDIGNVTLFV